MRSLRLLAWPGYLVAFLLMFVPFLDWAVTVWPLQFGNMRWRVGAAGQLSGGLMTVLIGLLVVFAIALALDQRRAQRVVVVLSGLLAAGTLVLVSLFVLDVAQLRGSVRPEVVHAFDIVAIQALTKQLLTLLTTLAFAVAAFKASRADGAARRARGAKDAPPVVVGSGGAR